MLLIPLLLAQVGPVQLTQTVPMAMILYSPLLHQPKVAEAQVGLLGEAKRVVLAVVPMFPVKAVVWVLQIKDMPVEKVTVQDRRVVEVAGLALGG